MATTRGFRPDVIVRQVFENPAPIVPATNLPVAVLAINRQFVWRKDAGSYIGGQPGQIYEFPELVAGSVVEQPTAVLDVPEFPDVLQPHIHIQNVYGTAELFPPDVSYSFATDPPTFSLDPDSTAIFEIETGLTGAYSAITGYFTDASADFVEAQVATADEIEVLHSDGNWYVEFDVANIISDDQLDVTRRNKAVTPALPDCTLSAEDAFGFRTIVDTTPQTFETNGVNVGDLVTVDGWDVLRGIVGGDYGAAGSGSGLPAVSRLFTDPTASFIVAGVLAGDVVFSRDTLGDWVPFFYVTSPPGVTTLPDVENIITLPTPNPPLTQAGTGVPYSVVNYSAPHIIDGAVGVYSAAGEYAAQGATLDLLTPAFPTWRIFRDATANFTAPGSTIVVGDEITLNYLGLPPGNILAPGNWPTFIVQTLIDATHLEVSQHDSNSPVSTASVLLPLLSIGYQAQGPTIMASNTGGSFFAEGTGLGGPTERRVLAAGVDFTLAPAVTAGDWLRDTVTGRTLFYVVTVHPIGIGSLDVINVIPGNPPAGSSSTNFTFEVTDQNPAILEVVRVLGESNLSVRNTIGGTPSAGEHLGLFVTAVTYPDSGADLNYRIKKTVSGAALNGDILATYTARRNDKITARTPVDVDTYETVFGPAVPGNDMSMALKYLFSVLGANAYGVQVAEDTDAAWDAALLVAADASIYIPEVVSQDESIIQKLITHVTLFSEPEKKRERISYLSHKEVVQTTRTQAALGDALTYNKSPTGITSIVSTTRDLSSYDVIIGDVFNGTLDDGVAQYPLVNARIITIQPATPLAGQSTMRIVASVTVPSPSAGTVLTGWNVKSKNLSLLERAEQQAAYAEAIKNRRIRNIWPDSVELSFTDETAGAGVATGFFGGGDQIATMGGQYLAIIEAGKRGNENPSQPLTGLVRGSVHKIIDPMGDIQAYQDIIIDGGNYYVVHDTDDQPSKAIRAISTDVTDLYYLEDNVASQVDSFARKLRTQLKPLVGPFIMDAPFFDLLSHEFQAVKNSVLRNKEMRDIVLLGMEEDPDHEDTFIVKCRVTPYISAAQGDITIYI